MRTLKIQLPVVPPNSRWCRFFLSISNGWLVWA
jgi:hypothetical protein